MRFLPELLVNAAALWLATQFIGGISFTGEWPILLVVAMVFGALNAIVRPILKLFTFPLLILTLGLFTFVLNACMLWLTGAVSERFALGFHVRGFHAAFFGALFVSVVSFFLSLFVSSDKKKTSTHKDE